MEKVTEQSQKNVSQTDKENYSKNTELVKNEKIEGTPFVARMQGGKWWVTMGDYRITELRDTKEEATEGISDAINWKFTTTVIAVIVEQVLNDLSKNK